MRALVPGLRLVWQMLAASLLLGGCAQVPREP